MNAYPNIGKEKDNFLNINNIDTFWCKTALRCSVEGVVLYRIIIFSYIDVKNPMLNIVFWLATFISMLMPTYAFKPAQLSSTVHWRRQAAESTGYAA